MSPRLRVWLIVGAAAAAAAGIAVGITLATRSDISRPTSKAPPFALDPTAPHEIAQQVREALRAWPAGTARRLRILAARYPHSALVRLELGLALAFAGQSTDAATAWRDCDDPLWGRRGDGSAGCAGRRSKRAHNSCGGSTANAFA